MGTNRYPVSVQECSSFYQGVLLAIKEKILGVFEQAEPNRNRPQTDAS